MRAEAAGIAFRMFLDRGFDDVTVDDLCAAMGLSRRSFFRYFKAKEDVVLAHLGDFAEKSCASFSSRPDQEELWPALRRSMDPFVHQAGAHPARTLGILRLIRDSPTLRAAHLDRIDRWRASLATVIAHRRGLENADLHATVLASAALGAFTSAVPQWAHNPDTTPLADLRRSSDFSLPRYFLTSLLLSASYPVQAHLTAIPLPSPSSSNPAPPTSTRALPRIRNPSALTACSSAASSSATIK